MSRFGRRLMLWSIVACFAVLFGVDLATSGVENIHGPLSETSVTVIDHALDETTPQHIAPAPPAAPPASADNLKPQLPPADVSGDSLVNRVADTTGNVLHGTAQKGVELIVSLFESILD